MNLRCDGCGATLTVDASMRTASCPYCASPSVVERPASADCPSPTFTVGFTLAQSGAHTALRTWLGSRSWFCPSSLRRASVESMRGIYVPAYLYTAVARASYAAEIGENYQETETHTRTDSQGRSHTETRTVTKTEYRSLQGAYAAYVHDVLVTASRGVSNDELERLEPFDLRALRRYTPALLSGWLAEEPTRSVDECVSLARAEASQKLGGELSAFMPGDSHRGLRYTTQLENESIDLVHVPLWILAVRHAEKAPLLRVLVNGQTGRVFGRAPLSWIKITLAVLLAVAVIAGIVAGIALASNGGAP